MIAEGKIDNVIYSDFIPLHGHRVARAMQHFPRLNVYYFVIIQTDEIDI